MSLKALAEAIMLQAAEDFLSEERHEEDVAFFGGEGFRICSELAGMNYPQQCMLLELISISAPVKCETKKTAAARGTQGVLHA
ncbi:MAG TPA: hypothetical protein VMB78_07335 [Dissulfurispiraceae bacterium]|nr:hypothetical protein [Dissulfurispiraceae bacterium]